MNSIGNGAREGISVEREFVALCPHCMTANQPERHFCMKCGTPLTTIAFNDPLGSVYAKGDFYRKALDRAGLHSLFMMSVASLVALFGLIGLVSIIYSIVSNFNLFQNQFGGNGLNGSYNLVFGLADLAIAILILYRLTPLGKRGWNASATKGPRGFEAIVPQPILNPVKTHAPKPVLKDSEDPQPDSSWETIHSGEKNQIGSVWVEEDQLVVLDPKIIARISSSSESHEVDSNDPVYGPAYRRYLLFRFWPDLLGSPPTDFEVFCNSYYWFLRFSTAYSEAFGKQEWLIHEGFDMIEEADVEMPWWVVEQIQQKAYNDDRYVKEVNRLA